MQGTLEVFSVPWTHPLGTSASDGVGSFRFTHGMTQCAGKGAGTRVVSEEDASARCCWKAVHPAEKCTTAGWAWLAHGPSVTAEMGPKLWAAPSCPVVAQSLQEGVCPSQHLSNGSPCWPVNSDDSRSHCHTPCGMRLAVQRPQPPVTQHGSYSRLCRDPTAREPGGCGGAPGGGWGPGCAGRPGWRNVTWVGDP